MNITPPSESFAFPSLTLDVPKILDFESWCALHMVTYRLGSKFTLVPNPPQRSVDCSGFFRYCVWLASGGTDLFPDGSWYEHQAVLQDHFKLSSVASGMLGDSVLRVAILDPSHTVDGIGHIALIWDGQTIESHGGHGPDRRPWTGLGWQSHCDVFVLTAPLGAAA